MGTTELKKADRNKSHIEYLFFKGNSLGIMVNLHLHHGPGGENMNGRVFKLLMPDEC